VIFSVCGVLDQSFAQVFSIIKGQQGGEEEVDSPKARIAHVIGQAVLGWRYVAEEGLHNEEFYDLVVAKILSVLGFAFAVFPKF